MKRMRHIELALGCCLAAMFSGCVTTMSPEDRSDFMAMRADVNRLEEKVNVINGRQESIEASQADLLRDIQAAGRTSGGDKATLDQRFRELDQRVTAVDNARMKDRDDIIKRLSGQIATVINNSRTSAGTGVVPRQGSGKEHVAQPGESLSGIAKAYGVTVDAMVKANGMSNADHIRVGQKLIIP